MNTVINETSNGEHFVRPTLTYSRAKELISLGREKIINAAVNKLDEPRSLVNKKCSLQTAIECHECEIRQWSGERPIRSSLARAIWFEHAPHITRGPICRWPISPHSRQRLDSYQFIMWDSEPPDLEVE